MKDYNSLDIPAEHPMFERMPTDKQERVDFLYGLWRDESQPKAVRIEAGGRYFMEFPPEPLSAADRAWAEHAIEKYLASKAEKAEEK